MKTLKFKPYFIEPLRSMRKISTIRKSDKGLKKEDIVECVFEGTNFSIFRIVENVYIVKNQEVGVLMFGAVKDILMNPICVKQNAHILK